MSYIWDNFNIKTFPAETIVFWDGVYQEQFSTLPKIDTISKNYDLPVHLIYIGKIAGEHNIVLNVVAPNQPVFLSIDIKNKFPAFLNIFIKNAGKNSEIRGHILLTNSAELIFKTTTEHAESDTSILLQTKIIGEKDSFSKLSGTAIIKQGCKNTVSDIKFAAMCDKTARLNISPIQKISQLPAAAEHSAYMFQPKESQKTYLYNAGLDTNDVDTVMRESFVKDFHLF